VRALGSWFVRTGHSGDLRVPRTYLEADVPHLGLGVVLHELLIFPMVDWPVAMVLVEPLEVACHLK
jgi:hypothetical protein